MKRKQLENLDLLFASAFCFMLAILTIIIFQFGGSYVRYGCF
jgi:hypothetical protein